jgi:hypothetical protein
MAVQPAAIRQQPMRVNIKSCDQVAPPARGDEKSVPQGHLIVAHYEVVGKGVKDSSVPEGRSNPQSSARIRPRERKQPIDRPLRDGSLLKKRDPPLRSGLLSNVPSSFALRATADRPGPGPFRMLLNLRLTRTAAAGRSRVSPYRACLFPRGNPSVIFQNILDSCL